MFIVKSIDKKAEVVIEFTAGVSNPEEAAQRIARERTPHIGPWRKGEEVSWNADQLGSPFGYATGPEDTVQRIWFRVIGPEPDYLKGWVEVPC